jgi:ribonuclease J
MTPDSEGFWFLPLGGTGEIGMNMNLYGHDG